MNNFEKSINDITISITQKKVINNYKVCSD